MKRTYTDLNEANGFASVVAEANNVMEGAPAGMPVVKANSVEISNRPHILAKRNSRWNRRAAR